MSSALFAVTPLFILPMVLLAMMATALLAWLVTALRRWWAFFNVVVVCLALYVVRFTFRGVARRFDESGVWWGTPGVFWMILALVTAAGVAWYWRKPPGSRPGTVEKLALLLALAACLALAAYWVWDCGVVPGPVWVLAASFGAGALSAFIAPTRLSPPAVVLTAAALVCGGLATVHVLGLG
jgi:hypothetical protein